MVHRLIQWAIDNTLVVVLLALALTGVGGFAFFHVNVEAYPDPAPAIVEVIAQFPGASAEEVERQVTVPLEVTLASMPRLKYMRSKSLFGLSHLRIQFEYGFDFWLARQEVINRLQFVDNLPSGVSPAISPQSPTGEILRYTLSNPRDPAGNGIYSLNDLKSIQDWVLERQFKRVPRIIDVVSFGGTVKRYEIHPDPSRLIRYGITLDQLKQAIADSNQNVGGDYLVTGENMVNVRGIGLIGNGLDPTREPQVLHARNPVDAAEFLRAEERRRVDLIRKTVIKSIDNVPIRVEDVIEGGPVEYVDEVGKEGVVVSNRPRLGKVALSRPRLDADGKEVRDATTGQLVWDNENEKVQGIVLMRKGEATLPSLEAVKERIKELNETAGRMLPGVQIEPYYDRTDLINVTTETVHENLFLGMVLVTVILLMFLSNVRSALIVAINIPLALMFAFAVLYLRGKSANLLSIGAVDFGIIVDSSVIMVENIYRHLTSGPDMGVSLKQRILQATREVEKSLFFTTAIMVCAFLPLFTMQGPEGQIFGPMADTYAFALGGALLLALTIAPVLCLLLFKNLKPAEDNFFVRWLKTKYLQRLQWCLRHRTATMVFMSSLLVGTALMVPMLGREFMPELEEGNMWIRGIFPISTSPAVAAEQSAVAQKLLEDHEEIKLIVAQIGRPDDGTDPAGFYNVEFFVPLKPFDEWPRTTPRSDWRRWFGSMRPRTKAELIAGINEDLTHAIPGVNWNFSQNIRDNVMEALSGIKGDNSVKIIGPDLDELERLAEKLQATLNKVPGIQNVGIFRVKGQPNLEFPVDAQKCNRWGVSVADVNDVIETAVGGKGVTQMVEGEKRFDVTLRWPYKLRASEQAILDIPVDLSNNVTSPDTPDISGTRTTGGAKGISPIGTRQAMPSVIGTEFSGALNNLNATPRRRLGDLVSPPNDGSPGSAEGQFMRSGASTIFREQGNRLIAVKFSVRGRDLAGAVAEARAKSESIFEAPYRTEWSGEFQEMQEAEHRLMYIVPISLVMIYILLYLAFHSFLDAILVFSNVVALSLGGVWALLLTGTNFSISAAVGFISIFGVAVMDGLLLISYFNQMRSHGLPLNEAIMQGAEKRVRPVMMTALTAIFGLLPAAFSTKIGAQTQQPLAIVVVGGMISTLMLTRYLMPVLYSYYGHREPPAGASSMAH